MCSSRGVGDTITNGLGATTERLDGCGSVALVTVIVAAALLTVSSLRPLIFAARPAATSAGVSRVPPLPAKKKYGVPPTVTVHFWSCSMVPATVHSALYVVAGATGAVVTGAIGPGATRSVPLASNGVLALLLTSVTIQGLAALPASSNKFNDFVTVGATANSPSRLLALTTNCPSAATISVAAEALLIR